MFSENLMAICPLVHHGQESPRSFFIHVAPTALIQGICMAVPPNQILGSNYSIPHTVCRKSAFRQFLQTDLQNLRASCERQADGCG
jgi:hypothetical protein